MLKQIYLIAIATCYCCGCGVRDNDIVLPDLNKIGRICDSLVSAGLHVQAANLYFKTAQDLGGCELYVYAAWQYGAAGMGDSALISINYAINHGMSNPNVLKTYQLDSFQNNSIIRREVEQRLDSIRQALSAVHNFEVVTEPLHSFWSYFKSALSDTAHAKKYLKRYIAEGSFATRDYYHKRYEHVDNMYRQMIQTTPEHYVYTRQFLNQDMIESLKETMVKMMYRLSTIYPHAVFPKVYLVPGILTGNGTQTELGLFAAAEMFVKSKEMPGKNLTDWQVNTIEAPKNMIFVIMHELMHFQQSYSDTRNSANLLGKVITEGSCDFLVELLSNDLNTLDAARIKKIAYLGNSGNLDSILAEFKKGMYSNDLSKWMYNGGAIKDRPSDLGYALGYKICKSYYDRSKNKETAIVELLTTDNFEEILAGSEYADIRQ